MSRSGDESEPKENNKFINSSMGENGHDNTNEQEETKKNSKIQNGFNSAKELIDKRYRLIIVALAIVTFVLLIIVFSVSIAKSSCKSDNLNYCRTSSCLKSASLLVDSLNSSVSPCEDFYSYACDGWLSKHRIPLNKGRYHLNDKIRRKINKELRYFIDLIPTEDASSVNAKLKRFYDSCIEAKNQDIKYFLDAISEKLLGWHMLDKSIFSTWDLNKAIISLLTHYDVDVFFRISVDIDHMAPNSPNLPIIKIEPAELGLPVAYYFDAQYKPFVDAYKAYMEEFLKQSSGKTAQTARTFAEDMFSFEKRLAEFTPHPHEWLNGTKIYTKHRVRDLNTFIKRIEFLEVLQRYFSDANINDKTIVMLAFENYFRRLSNLVTTADSTALNNYLIWRFAMKFMRYLPKEYIALHSEFTQKMNGIEKPVVSDFDERWELCVEATNEFLHLAMADIYIKHQTDYSTVKSDVSDIITNLTSTLVSSIPNYHWVHDKQTEEKAIAKIQNVLLDVSFPKMYSDDAISKYYRILDVRTVFFNNIERAIGFRQKKYTEILKNEWPIAWPIKLLDIDGLYNYAGNHLYIAAGLLHSPIYDVHYPLAMKYGSFGFIIASQLLKSLDIYGIGYNENGHLVDKNAFLSIDSEVNLNRSASCFEHELRTKLNRSMLDSRLVLSQTYTDIGALKLVRDTYKRVIKELGKDEALPGISASGDQLLFISFAQTQCESIRPKYKVAKYPLLTALPGKERVDVIYSYYKRFSESFDCSRENPECQLW